MQRNWRSVIIRAAKEIGVRIMLWLAAMIIAYLITSIVIHALLNGWYF